MPIGVPDAGANTRASSHKSIVHAFHAIPDDSRPESPWPRTSIATTWNPSSASRGAKPSHVRPWSKAP